MSLAQHMDQWMSFVNKVMNLRVPWKVGKFLVAAELVTPQEGFDPMKLVDRKMAVINGIPTSMFAKETYILAIDVCYTCFLSCISITFEVHSIHVQ
jgi:hypothetical protein